MLNLEAIGNKISKRRKELKLTQNELAERLYVTHQAVSKWENGKSLPTIDLLYDLTVVLEMNIDYLLDDTDIEENDYETKFKQYPRESVLTQFLQNDPVKEIDHFFYLCTKPERKVIIDLVINKKTPLQIEDLWHNLSKEERLYVLQFILSGYIDYDLNDISTQLSISEYAITVKHYKDGTYPYKLPTRKGVML